MELSQQLTAAIASTHVAFEGLSYPLRLVNAELDTARDGDAASVTITVATDYAGQTKRATCTFRRAAMDDTTQVTAQLADAMRRELSGSHGDTAGT